MLQAIIYGEERNTATITTNFSAPYGTNDNIVGEKIKSINFLSFDGDGVDLTKSSGYLATGDFVGSTYPTLSGEDKSIAITDITNGFAVHYISDDVITLRISGNSVAELTVIYVVGGSEEERETITVDGDLSVIKLKPEYTDCYIHPTKTTRPYEYARFNGILSCDAKLLNKFKSHTLTEEINVISADLPMNEFTAEISSEESIIPNKHEKMYLFSNNIFYGAYYVDTVARTSEYIYSITAYDILSILDKRPIEWFTMSNLNAWDTIDYMAQSSGVPIDVADTTLKTKMQSTRYTHFDDPQATPLGILHNRFEFWGQIDNSSMRYLLCCLAFAMSKVPFSARKEKIILKDLPTQRVIWVDPYGFGYDEMRYEDTGVEPTKFIGSDRILGEATFTEKEATSRITATFSLPFGDENSVETTSYPSNAGERVYGSCDSPSYWKPANANATIGKQTPYKFESVPFASPFNVKRYPLNYTDYSYSYLNENVSEQVGQEETLSNTKVAFCECIDTGWYYNNHTVGMPVVYQPRNVNLQRYANSKGTVSAKIILDGEQVGDYIEINTAWQGKIKGIITKMTTTFGYDDISDIEVIQW